MEECVGMKTVGTSLFINIDVELKKTSIHRSFLVNEFIIEFVPSQNGSNDFNKVYNSQWFFNGFLGRKTI